jgi:hypothetical protein
MYSFIGVLAIHALFRRTFEQFLCLMPSKRADARGFRAWPAVPRLFS